MEVHQILKQADAVGIAIADLVDFRETVEQLKSIALALHIDGVYPLAEYLVREVRTEEFLIELAELLDETHVELDDKNIRLFIVDFGAKHSK